MGLGVFFIYKALLSLQRQKAALQSGIVLDTGGCSMRWKWMLRYVPPLSVLQQPSASPELSGPVKCQAVLESTESGCEECLSFPGPRSEPHPPSSPRPNALPFYSPANPSPFVVRSPASTSWIPRPASPLRLSNWNEFIPVTGCRTISQGHFSVFTSLSPVYEVFTTISIIITGIKPVLLLIL